MTPLAPGSWPLTPGASHGTFTQWKCIKLYFQALRKEIELKLKPQESENGDVPCEKHVPSDQGFDWSMSTFDALNIDAAINFDAQMGLVRVTEWVWKSNIYDRNAA